MTGPTRWAWIVSIDVARVANAKAGEARPSTKVRGSVQNVTFAPT